ncbi:MAG: excinuclease ABC subunit UvrC, partial [Bacteroidia bacterium]
MNPLPENIENMISTLPGNPGVYQFYDQDGLLMYVGKAKNIKKRVGSYFNKIHDSGRTSVMVKKIRDIKYIVVETEMDALLLENNLIKKHQPRYNVMLKDDKTYPWICIKNERFPRIFSTRTVINDGSVYFGPYPSVRMINTLLDLIYQLYKLRNCNLALSDENIQKEKFRVCLEYHVGNCKGPCEGHQNELDYNETIAQIKEILKGNITVVINHLKNKMLELADKFEFEQAHIIKNKLDILEKFKSKSVIVNPVIHNVDVYSILMEGHSGFVNFMKVINGAIVQSFTLELKKKLEETPAELLALAITELRTRYNSNSPEIIVAVDPEIEIPGVTITIPKIGDKKHLLDLSEKNTKYYIKEKLDLFEKLNPGSKVQRLLEKMQKELRLSELPVHIECFDNSNMQGTFPVAAMTVFRNAKPFKKDYRLYNIRTVTGPNDFASMEEVVY